ncbi:MAG: acyloxyacyl hydrolase [Rehaibacterium terrae]|uniref:acyloxyacyl hydrolase n=1 Tax=Rehaibacterium terrae TaxID=1341696 RepID=UPI00391C6939
MRPLSIALSCALALAAGKAGAEVSLGFGHVDEIEGESSHLFTLAYTTAHRHPWEFMAGHIDGRDDAGELNTPGVNFVSASKQLRFGHWFASGGIAWTDSDTEVLSEKWQFMTGIGWRSRRFGLSLRHLSNANTGGRNRGENFLLAEYRF